MSDAAIARLQNDVSGLRVAQAATDATVAGGRDVVIDVKGTVKTRPRYRQPQREGRRDGGRPSSCRKSADLGHGGEGEPEADSGRVRCRCCVLASRRRRDWEVSLDAFEGKVDVVTTAGAATPGPRLPPVVVPIESGGGDYVRDEGSDIPMVRVPRPLP